MTNEELILQKITEISARLDTMDNNLSKVDAKVDEGLEKVNRRLDHVTERLDTIEEKLSEHSDALNSMIEWAEDVQVVVKIPFGKG